MFVLGHLGIGQALAWPWLRRLPRKAFFAGALLPDAIDKPVYYGLTLLTGRHGADLGMFAGTRSFGHTLLLTMTVGAIGLWRRSVIWQAVALGMLTHLVLDTTCDFINQGPGPADPHAIPGYAAVVWPLLGWRFPIAPFVSLAGHAEALRNPTTLGGEVIGGVLLLGWAVWQRTRTRVGLAASTASGG